MTQDRFETLAASWDDNIDRQAMAAAIANGILTQTQVQPGSAILDFGCGTGLITLSLLPYARHIIGVDVSKAMIARLHEKINAAKIENVEVFNLDLQTDLAPNWTVDLVVSGMAFHHLRDVPKVLDVLARMLVPGGVMAIADLDKEDGTFHTDHTGIYHSGFERSWVADEMRRVGLEEIQMNTAHVVHRETAEGPREYPVFVISGRKP